MLCGQQRPANGRRQLVFARSDMITKSRSYGVLRWMPLFLSEFWVGQEQAPLSGTWHRAGSNGDSVAVPDTKSMHNTGNRSTNCRARGTRRLSLKPKPDLHMRVGFAVSVPSASLPCSARVVGGGGGWRACDRADADRDAAVRTPRVSVSANGVGATHF